ncbi:MAG: glycosidase [candidate division KSB1 bacterium]|nr:glycosidase [candidate division KSB1 bacterium]MDZ7272857.1 glycosidase [candidate division KSB1 bacterium]MDZ7284120.1 glycosidase [candidate division KSB1 bacterium]MDZ7297482.1 glycosidase [candidate division KSB1 bacterium]MDZ7305618.1 glycosidase [candidate division KSB1 bacterium]
MKPKLCYRLHRAARTVFLCLFVASGGTLAQHVRLPFLPLQPYEGNPILRPLGTTWEAAAATNPAAVVKDTTIYLFYQAKDRSGAGRWHGTSRIGLATSVNGLQFTRESQPVMVPTHDYETPGGCENPHLVEIEGVYYLTYDAFDSVTRRLALASSRDLRHWIKHGLVFPEEKESSHGVIAPQKSNGRYFMYFSDGKNLRLAYSENLLVWQAEATPVMQPRPGKFDELAVAPAFSPVLIGSEMVLFYNGLDPARRSQPGQAVFALANPGQVLLRSERPYLSPLPWHADESAVRLSALVRLKEEYFLYFGINEETVGVAVSQELAAAIRAQK